MTTVVRLLGTPAVEVDGTPQPAPRGHKAWGLLAYLVLAAGPVSRAQLCSLLFAEADDPLAALRWNLSRLRQLLGDPAVLRGDPLRLRLANGDVVDVRTVLSGSWDEADDGIGAELLEGLDFSASPSFDVWLESQRRHLRGASEDLLHERALGLLASGDAGRAASLASRLVALNPWEEDFQALLVRALAASGDGVGAARQAASCRELFRRELGVDPGEALEAAARTLTREPVAAPTGGRVAVRALTDAGNAAIAAGAVDPGVECLRRAVADARALGDAGLEARALTDLGAALVHAVRGRDEEGATALHQAVALADPSHPAVLADACRELGFVEFMRGRYGRVGAWLRRAERSVGDDHGRLARVLSVRGSAASDTGRYTAALGALAQAARWAEAERDRSYALSMVGRVHLLRGDLEEATEALEDAIDRATRSGGTGFLPWPQSLRAEVDLASGDVDSAERRLEHAFALGCHIGDPCWEGVSARGLGRVRAARGDVTGAVVALLDARVRCRRLPDGYVWLDGWILDALCELAVGAGLDDAPAWVAELDRLAASHGMRELVVRAKVHARGLGAGPAYDVLRALAADVDNASLTRLVADGAT